MSQYQRDGAGARGDASDAAIGPTGQREGAGARGDASGETPLGTLDRGPTLAQQGDFGLTSSVSSVSSISWRSESSSSWRPEYTASSSGSGRPESTQSFSGSSSVVEVTPTRSTTVAAGAGRDPKLVYTCIYSGLTHVNTTLVISGSVKNWWPIHWKICKYVHVYKCLDARRTDAG
jgi:hypothetical protein